MMPVPGSLASQTPFQSLPPGVISWWEGGTVQQFCVVTVLITWKTGWSTDKMRAWPCACVLWGEENYMTICEVY